MHASILYQYMHGHAHPYTTFLHQVKQAYSLSKT